MLEAAVAFGIVVLVFLFVGGGIFAGVYIYHWVKDVNLELRELRSDVSRLQRQLYKPEEHPQSDQPE